MAQLAKDQFELDEGPLNRAENRNRGKVVVKMRSLNNVAGSCKPRKIYEANGRKYVDYMATLHDTAWLGTN